MRAAADRVVTRFFSMLKARAELYSVAGDTWQRCNGGTRDHDRRGGNRRDH